MDRMITVNVELGERAYPIHIGADLIGQTALFAPHIAGSSVTIVTNTTVDPLYGDTLRAALAPLGKQVSTVVLPDGEALQEPRNPESDFRRAARLRAPTARPR